MYSKKTINKLLVGSMAIAMLFIASCQNGNQSATQQVADSTAISQDVKELIYPLPTPFELTQTLKDIGAKYNASVLNPTAKADKYFKESAKAINLGVYAGDLAYAASFEQKQDINLYSKTIKDMIDALGVNIDYSKLMSDDLKSKINNKDTLAKIISNTYSETYKYLYEKSNPDYALMMVSGMWVELMYIATNISQDTYHFSGMVDIITKQEKSYTKLMSLLAERNSNPEIKELETKLLVLKPVYDKAQNGLTEQDYLTILTTIQSVRKSIVQ